MSWSYRPSLDGLRTLAMYLIVLFHAGVPWVDGGFIAVNLFFVLSGYLVTNVILSEIDRTGTLSLRDFYARRVRRLLPAALVAIVGISVLFLLVTPVVRRLSIIGDAQSALLYVANWRFIQQSNDYFATDVDKSPFLHFWTLGIEEQFYVVFPIVLLLLAKATRRWVMFAGLTAIFLASLASQIYWAGVNEMYAYFATDARLYQLVAGALLAVGFRLWQVRMSRWAATTIAGVGMLVFLLLSLSTIEMSTSLRGIIGTVACTMLIAGLMQAEDQPMGRILSRPTPVYLGKISYATYLWHWPAILVLQMVFEIGPLAMSVIAAVLATAMAAASAELIEMPVRRSEFLNRFGWRTVTAGVTASVLAAVAVVPWVLEKDRRPAIVVTGDVPVAPVAATQKAQGRAESPKPKDTSLPKDVDWRKVEEDKGVERSCDASDVDRCTVVEGSGPHVLLVGDSHAQMLTTMFMALAEDRDFTLSLNVVGGCPWQEELTNSQVAPELQADCTDARVGWYDEVLPELSPDIVVIANFPRDGSPHLKRRDGKKEPSDRAILRASKATLAKVEAVSARALLIESMIVPSSFRPNDCLTSTDDPEECTVLASPKNRSSDGIYLASAAEFDHVYTVDLNPAFCPDAPVCHPVVDGEVVWRDKHHLAPSYAKKQRKEAWRLIRRTGVLDDVALS
jgi:peptidoglycan/LPS O-acetylase OafA/YrhL